MAQASASDLKSAKPGSSADQLTVSNTHFFEDYVAGVSAFIPHLVIAFAQGYITGGRSSMSALMPREPLMSVLVRAITVKIRPGACRRPHRW